MNLVDSVHGRVDPCKLPELDAKAHREGRPTTPIFQASLRYNKDKASVEGVQPGVFRNP